MGDLADAGAVAFSDDGSPVADAGLLRHALEYATAFGLPLVEHCEEPALSREGVMHEGWVATRLGLRGIPAAAEEAAVARAIALAELTGAHLHVAHVSTAGSVDLVRRAKERGSPVTAEVTPHHLALTHEAVMVAAASRIARRPGLRYQRQGQPAPAHARRRRGLPARPAGRHHRRHRHRPRAPRHRGQAVRVRPRRLRHQRPGDGAGPLPVAGARRAAGPADAGLQADGGPGAGLRAGARRSRPGEPGRGRARRRVVFDPEAEWTVEPERFASRGRTRPWPGADACGAAWWRRCTAGARPRITAVQSRTGQGQMSTRGRVRPHKALLVLEDGSVFAGRRLRGDGAAPRARWCSPPR